MASVALLIVFPFLMAYAAVRDLLTMLIPNMVSLLLLAGFALFAVATGLWGWDLMSHLGAGAATLTVTFTLFAFGKIGGGDAKLAAATAVWIGFDRLLEYLAVASLAGGVLSLAILMARAHPLPPLLGRLPLRTPPTRCENGRTLRNRPLLRRPDRDPGDHDLGKNDGIVM